ATRDFLLAAQRRLLRGLLLRLARSPPAVSPPARAGGLAAAASAPRRARGAVPEDARAGGLRAVLDRGHLRLPRPHADGGSGLGHPGGGGRRRLGERRGRRPVLARVRAAVLHGARARRHVTRRRHAARGGALWYGARAGPGR